VQVKAALLAASCAACTVAQAGPNGGGKAKATTKAKPTAGCAAQDVHDPWPYLDAPADPWRAVADGKPIGVVLSETAGTPGEATAACDAAHDHCLRDCTWLMVQPNTSNKGTISVPFHYSSKGEWIRAQQYGDVHPQPGFIAYRTVPATKKNLAKGVYVFAVKAPAQEAWLESFWDPGVVESIDWDAGTVRLKDRAEAYYIAATRVGVLKFADGADKVEAIEGVDATTPKVADVFLPTARKKTASDPWSAVGKNKQPIAAAAPGKLTEFADECTPATDHCLLPWVWFVDASQRKIQPARWTGKKFVRAADEESELTPRLAYRTRPAKPSEVVVGAKLLVFDSAGAPASQREAHMWTNWIIDKPIAVDAKAQTFELENSGTTYPMANARVLVLYWLPGEDAAAFE
jgi:hypothetical protein